MSKQSDRKLYYKLGPEKGILNRGHSSGSTTNKYLLKGILVLNPERSEGFKGTRQKVNLLLSKSHNFTSLELGKGLVSFEICVCKSAFFPLALLERYENRII